MSETWDNVVAIASTPYFADRGCHVRILDVLNNIPDSASRVILITYPLGRELGQFRIVRTMRIPWYRTYSSGPNIHKWYLDILLFIRAYRVIQRTRPRVLYCFLHESALIGLWLRWLFRIPVIFDCQGSLTEELIDHQWLRRGSVLYRCMWLIEKFVYQRVDAIVTSSESLTAWLRTALPHCRTPLYTLSDAVDLKTFAVGTLDPTERRELGIPQESYVVAFMGLLTEHQGIEDFVSLAVSVCEQRSDVHILVIGFPDEDKYRARVASMRLTSRFTFTGRVAYEQIPRWLRVVTVAVSPKRSQTEGNGKLLHFMAAAVPVVCYDTPVNRAILGDLGVYAPLGDVSALTTAVMTVLDMPASTRMARGAALRERVLLHHSWDQRRRELCAVIDRVSQGSV